MSYAKLISQSDGVEEIFDTTFETIPTASSGSEPAPERATQKRYREAMEQLAKQQQRDAADASMQTVELDSFWIEKDHSASEPQPKYLLYTNGKLLGYSLLERHNSDGRRSGRFHPAEDYFEYANIFAALPQAENECFETNVREASGIFEPEADEYRQRFNELSVQVDELKLYVEEESGQRLETSELKLEDLSQHYNDEKERWLYLTLPVAL